MISNPIVLSISLLLTIPLLLLLAPRFFPPHPFSLSIPEDDADDIALLRRASTLSSAATTAKSRLSTSSKPKIAFLFLTNSDLHFSPLWDRFFHGHHHLFNLYIHADPTKPFSPPTSSSSAFGHRLIPSKPTSRASPSLISAARRLLATALLHDPSNAFFALLSQHCIPLHPFPFVYSSIFLNNAKPSGSNSTMRGANQQQSFIEILTESAHLRDRYTARGKYAMLPEVPFEKFRVGSQFFVLTRRHALVVVRDRRLWKKFRLPCYRADSCYPEEHYFPTLLSMEDPNGCTKYTLTRVNWTGSTQGHPHTYHPPEISPELIYKLRFSNSTYSYLFARKFSPDCLSPLMKIADSVIFRD